jgi:nickel/cobalt exporter
MRSTRGCVFLLLALGLVAISLLRPQGASAHPLGNFTVNTLSIVELAAEQISVHFIVDMAEIPAFQERAGIDLNGDDTVSEEERVAYLDSKAKEIEQGFYLTVDGAPVELSATEQELEFPPGQGGLLTTRLVVSFLGSTPRLDGQTHDLYFRNDNYSQRVGFKDVIIKGKSRIRLIESTASQSDITDGLRLYPEDLLSSPPDLREVRSTFALAGNVQLDESQPASAFVQPASRPRDFLTTLITTQSLNLPVIILSFMVALGLGALHAASPGHGKTIMAAYLVGTRGTAKHALFLGITVTVSHTLGVLGLGLVVLYASHLIVPERLYPWLSLVSGVVIVAVGVWLLLSRLRISYHHHDVGSHDYVKREPASLLTRIKRLGAKAFHGHTHDHPHHHTHSHELPAGGNRLRLTWQSLTALGIVGGLVPSASALIILLAAISLQRVGFGLALILAFSAGMAAVLTGVGLALVYARRFVERFQLRGKSIGTLYRVLPLAAALVVLLSGLVIAVRAVFQVGLV